MIEREQDFSSIFLFLLLITFPSAFLYNIFPSGYAGCAGLYT